MPGPRLVRLLLPFAALVIAGIVVGGAGAARSQKAGASTALHLNAAAADCAGPSAIDIEHSDSFWYWPCASFLHVEISPADASVGFVQSDPYYIDCPLSCTRPFDSGAKTTLWAFPSTGTAFTSWSGDACAGQGNPCVATVTGDETVTANFSGTVTPPAQPPTPPAGPFQVHVFMGNVAVDTGNTVTGTGGFTCTISDLNCFKTYPAGTVVTFTDATGCTSAYFTDSATGGVADEGNPYTFTVSSDRTVNPHVTGCAG